MDPHATNALSKIVLAEKAFICHKLVLSHKSNLQTYLRQS